MADTLGILGAAARGIRGGLQLREDFRQAKDVTEERRARREERRGQASAQARQQQADNILRDLQEKRRVRQLDIESRKVKHDEETLRRDLAREEDVRKKEDRATAFLLVKSGNKEAALAHLNENVPEGERTIDISVDPKTDNLTLVGEGDKGSRTLPFLVVAQGIDILEELAKSKKGKPSETLKDLGTADIIRAISSQTKDGQSMLDDRQKDAFRAELDRRAGLDPLPEQKSLLQQLAGPLAEPLTAPLQTIGGALQQGAQAQQGLDPNAAQVAPPATPVAPSEPAAAPQAGLQIGGQTQAFTPLQQAAQLSSTSVEQLDSNQNGQLDQADKMVQQALLIEENDFQGVSPVAAEKVKAILKAFRAQQNVEAKQQLGVQ